MLGHDCGTEESMTQLGNHRTNLGLLNHSSGLLLLSQGLQGLQTWAWTKSKRPPLTLTLTQPSEASQGALKHTNTHLLASMTIYSTLVTPLRSEPIP